MYYRDAVALARRHRRIDGAPQLKGGHAVGAAKQCVVVGIIKAADGCDVRRVGDVDQLDAVVIVCGDHHVRSGVKVEYVQKRRAVKIGVAGVTKAVGRDRAGRVGDVDQLDAVVADGGDHRVRAAVLLEDGHVVRLSQLPSAVVAEVAGGGGVGRVGEVDNLDAVILHAGHYRVDGIVFCEDGQAARVAEVCGAVVPQAAGGNRAGRVGDVDQLDAVVVGGGDRHIGVLAPLKDGRADGAVKQQGAVVPQAAGGVRAGRVGEVHHLDAVVNKSRDDRVRAAVPLEDGHVVRVGEFSGGVVEESAGGIRAGRVGNIHHLDAVVGEGGNRRVCAAVPLEDGHAARVHETGGGVVGYVGHRPYVKAKDDLNVQKVRPGQAVAGLVRDGPLSHVQHGFVHGPDGLGVLICQPERYGVAQHPLGRRAAEGHRPSRSPVAHP